MRQKINSCIRWLARHPLLLVFIAGSLLFAFGVADAHAYKIYDSDDLAQQVNVKFSTEPGRHEVSYPTDSFIIKFPLYYLVNMWRYGTRMNVFVTVLTLAMGAYWLFVAGAYWLLVFYYPGVREERQTFRNWLPLLLPPSLGLFFFILFVNPNLRSIEIGMAFVGLAAIFWLVFRSKIYNWPFSFESIVWTVFASLVLGLFLYNDPYFMFMFFLPAAAVCIWFACRQSGQRNRYITAAGIMLGAVAANYLWIPFWAHFGIVSHSAATAYADFSMLPHNVLLTLQGLFGIFNANLWGKRAFSAAGLSTLMSLIFVFVVLLAHRNKNVRRSLSSNFLHQFVIVQLIVAVGLYMFSSNAWDVASTRYLVIVPFSFAILTAIVIRTHTNRVITRCVLPGLLILVAMGGLAQNAYLFKHRTVRSTVYPMTLPIQTETLDERNIGNRLNERVAQILVQNHLTKGYGDYWDSYVNTFFSKNQTRVLPTHCDAANKLAVYSWSLDTNSLNYPASVTYFLFNDRADFSTSDLWCGSEKRILAQFGQPARVVPIVQGMRLYVYTFDLKSRMGID